MREQSIEVAFRSCTIMQYLGRIAPPPTRLYPRRVTAKAPRGWGYDSCLTGKCC